jgi:NAD(P)-dependent dehydrogenase (short-subunit alcohol dehydrogenase family)
VNTRRDESHENPRSVRERRPPCAGRVPDGSAHDSIHPTMSASVVRLRPGRPGKWPVMVALAGVLSAGASGLGGQTAPTHTTRGAGDEDRRWVVLVTGSTDGLGAEVARRLGDRGAHVIIHGRNRERGEAVVAEIERDGPGSAAFYAADLANLAAVSDLADAIRSDYDRLDVLVNNAGIWLNDGVRRVSDDGHELHFAVNYLAGFLLTRRLLPLLRQSAPARIVNVASGAQQPIDFDDPMIQQGYTAGRAYARSKLAQVLFTVDLAAELDGTGVQALALHPATLMDTPMVREAGVQPRSTVDEGAEAVMHLITAAGLESGSYFSGLRPARAHDQAYDADARQRLRRLSEELIADRAPPPEPRQSDG